MRLEQGKCFRFFLNEACIKSQFTTEGWIMLEKQKSPASLLVSDTRTDQTLFFSWEQKSVKCSVTPWRWFRGGIGMQVGLEDAESGDGARLRAAGWRRSCDSSRRPRSILTSCRGNCRLRRRRCPESLLFCRFWRLSCCYSPTARVRLLSPGRLCCLFASRPPGRPALWPSYSSSTSCVCSGTRF